MQGVNAMHAPIRWFARSSSLAAAFALLAALAPLPAPAQKDIDLPKPRMEGGLPLMQALKARQSGREFSPERLPLPVLSNLLWAAWGVNRSDGRRTAPSAPIGRRSTSTSPCRMASTCSRLARTG